jgi:hypothetical protein
MFIHPSTALELAVQKRAEDERRVRLRFRPLAEERKVRPLRKAE